MRTLNAFGAAGMVIIEEIGVQGELRFTASGTLTRTEVQEVTDWLTAYLRETKDNIAKVTQLQLPLEWKDGSRG